MKRLLLLLLLLCLLPMPEAAAAPFVSCMPSVKAESCAEVKRLVKDALADLTVAKNRNWPILVMNTGEFLVIARAAKSPTNTAFTNLKTGVTYLSADYFLSADRKLLRQTLAHEWGHVLTESRDEDKANEAANKILTSNL